jgi:Protein of unknown function (DUF2857)
LGWGNNVIGVQSALLQEIAVLSLVAQIEVGDYQDLIRSGISTGDIDRLRGFRAAELKQLAAHMGAAVQITLDPIMFTASLKRLCAMQREAELFEYYIRHGASIPMLREVFKADGARISAARKLLPRPAGGGRPQMPSDEQRRSILQKWLEIGPKVHAREKYWLLHQMNGRYGLQTLFAVINESI